MSTRSRDASDLTDGGPRQEAAKHYHRSMNTSFSPHPPACAQQCPFRSLSILNYLLATSKQAPIPWPIRFSTKYCTPFSSVIYPPFFFFFFTCVFVAYIRTPPLSSTPPPEATYLRRSPPTMSVPTSTPQLQITVTSPPFFALIPQN